MFRIYLRRLIRRRLALLGAVLTLLVVAVALAAPLLAPYPPHQQHPGQELRQPSSRWLVGTDEFGRDLYSRILYGTRISLLVGVVAVGIGTIAGTVLGLLSGYLGGWTDAAIMRVCDALLSFPPILTGIGVAAVLGPGSLNLSLAAGIVSVPTFARIVRGSVLAERDKEYVAAAIGMGAADGRIMARHILPNVRSPLLVQMAIGMAYAVNLEASLAFLGLGAQPPEASLGATLNYARNFLRQAPWYGLFPGIMLAVIMTGLNFLADAVRDVLDPRQKDLR